VARPDELVESLPDRRRHPRLSRVGLLQDRQGVGQVERCKLLPYWSRPAPSGSSRVGCVAALLASGTPGWSRERLEAPGDVAWPRVPLGSPMAAGLPSSCERARSSRSTYSLHEGERSSTSSSSSSSSSRGCGGCGGEGGGANPDGPACVSTWTPMLKPYFLWNS
jgi:hypothetical protein